MKGHYALIGAALFITGCAQTYWAFPPGQTLADFKNDEAQCRAYVALNFEGCLSKKGYRQIGYNEYVQIQKK